MSDDLSKTDSWNLLYRLREYWGVPQAYVAELERRLNQGKHDRGMRDQAERRVRFLEQHVPPEILTPPAVQTKRVRFTGD